LSSIRTTPTAAPAFVVFTRRNCPAKGVSDIKCIGVHSTRNEMQNHVQACPVLDLSDDDVPHIFGATYATERSFEFGTDTFFHVVDDEEIGIMRAEVFYAGSEYDDSSKPYTKALLDFIIPPTDQNGNPWSNEQWDSLREFAHKIILGNTADPARIAISSVAGSGKSSLINGMERTVARWNPTLRISSTAFNTHIAIGRKDALNGLKKEYGLNANILGRNNTVNAGGHALLTAKAKAEGFSRVELIDAGEHRWTRFCRIVLSGALGSSLYGMNLNSLVICANQLDLKTTSHAFNDLSYGLRDLCTILMNEGFVPRTMGIDTTADGYFFAVRTSTEEEWDEEITEAVAIVKRVGVNQGWVDNSIASFGDRVACRLAMSVLALGIHSAFKRGKHRPHCDGNPWTDAVVPVKDSRLEKYWEDANTVKALTRTKDPAKVDQAHWQILRVASAVFPPVAKKDNDFKSVSLKTQGDSATKVVIAQDANERIVMTFENEGQKEKLDGTWIGRQFGKQGTYKVDGKRIAPWAKYDRATGVRVVQAKRLDDLITVLSLVFKQDEIDIRLDGYERPVEDASIDLDEAETGTGACLLTMDDQVYLPHALDLSLPESQRVDVMMIDEVQDLSVLKAQLVWRLTKSDAHIAICGDISQAIYLFAGASSSAFHDNAKEIGATYFPQTVCWRGAEMVAASARVACADAIAQVRAMWGDKVPATNYHNHKSPAHPSVADQFGHLNWSRGPLPITINPDEVSKAVLHAQELLGAGTTFGLLCRLKAPLAEYLIGLVKQGIPVSTPSGKDGLIKQAFNATANRTRTSDKVLSGTWAVKKQTRIGLGWKDRDASGMTRRIAIKELEQLKQHAVQKFTDLHGGHAKAIASDSNFEDLSANIDLMVAFVNLYFDRTQDFAPSGKFADVLFKWVKTTLFTEEGGTAVHISTIHRYKGEEADVMFIIDSIKTEEGTMPAFMSPRSMEASVDSALNEANMCYVAWTRAKVWNIVVNAGENYFCDLKAVMTAGIEHDVEGVLKAPKTDDPTDTPTEAFEPLEGDEQ